MLNTLIFSNNLFVRIFRHVLFWGVDIANYLLIISVNTPIDSTEVYRILFRIPLIALAAYFVIYYLIPRYSKKENSLKLLFWIVVVLLYLGIGVRYYRYFILEPIIAPDRVIDFYVWDYRRVLSEILGSMVVVSMAIAIKVIKSKAELQQKNEELNEEKKRAELKFLKAQMHPHFLFNTLNTLYSETIHKTEKADQVVLHLSNLMRFILDECNKSLIPVRHEVKVIRDFIFIEKLRFGKRLQVNYQAEEFDREYLISPLIILPFVENSFKHTVTKHGEVVIDIKLWARDDQLHFEIENDNVKKGGHEKTARPGKGIMNAKRQLELLYPDEYRLEVNESPEKFSVSLVIPMKKQHAND